MVQNSYLVRQSQAQLDLQKFQLAIYKLHAFGFEYPKHPHLVGNGLGISSPLDGHSHGCRASSESRTGNTEGVHGDCEDD